MMARSMLLALVVVTAGGCGAQTGVAAPAPSYAETTHIAIDRIDAGQLGRLRTGQTVRLDLGQGRTFQVRTLGVEAMDGGRVGWRGAVIGPGGPDGEVSLVVNGDKPTGSLSTGAGETFKITPTAAGPRVERTDHAAMKPD